MWMWRTEKAYEGAKRVSQALPLTFWSLGQSYGEVRASAHD
ncbi:hypothetical protein FHT60_004365 [Novosphingobium sp. BK486]|nr:hypothetical protein [Novosphingobium sp. BK256]MBB3376907.1 hypothetical protein [Novosphingobium sp. BK280]MBB3381277.1 hypothetical protein [Novosphingobium sp. BK258]MBB3422969.1 hypothetical protein [Novosphingobium sp. BK267]MBB3451671.1 hypothetical protein [Novosphingobium sp. BK352]MBB3480176.1 hypothetical protein [Novosphingobium sp. BK369]MBB3503492.1 hypothetical protein [Novosphingobium sp. BK336]MBB3539236.1 hypothetical protein [Novosphingobium sp. BK486]MBB3558632.1 hypo